MASLPNSAPAILPSAPVKQSIAVTPNTPNLIDYLKATSPVVALAHAAAQDYQNAATLTPAAQFGAGLAAPVRIPLEAAASVSKAALAPLAGLPTLANQVAGGAVYGNNQPLITPKSSVATQDKTQKQAAPANGAKPTQVASSAVLDPRAEAMKGLLGLGTRQDLNALVQAPLTRYSPAEEAIMNMQVADAQKEFAAAYATAKTPKDVQDAIARRDAQLAVARGGSAATLPTTLGYLEGVGPGGI